MKIAKLINNNAVYVNEEGKEIIFTGPGLGFNKKIGDPVDEKRIEKRFYLEDAGFDAYEKMLKRVDPVFLEIGLEIKENAEKELNTKTSNQLIFSLADHINFSVMQAKENKHSPNLMNNEIKIIYPKEYRIGESSLDLIEKRTSVRLADDEAAYIAMHIINANTNNYSSQMNDVLIIIQKFSKIIQDNYGIAIEQDSFDYTRFITHIKYLINRINGCDSIASIGVTELIEPLIQKDNRLITTISEMKKVVNDEFDYELSQDDEFYLMLHILRIIL